jgi:hypothetical protein
VKGAAVKVTVDSKKVRETLAALPMRLNESIRKKAIRKVFKQPVKDLKNEFRTMNFRGKKPHRRAIASATKLLAPKRMGKLGSPIRADMGVQYGAKGGARAKGLQRVFHLLEDGFRHKSRGIRRLFGVGRFISGNHRAKRWANKNVSKIGSDLQDEILRLAAKELGVRNAS